LKTTWGFSSDDGDQIGKLKQINLDQLDLILNAELFKPQNILARGAPNSSAYLVAAGQQGLGQIGPSCRAIPVTKAFLATRIPRANAA
jgi:hypothetical protein